MRQILSAIVGDFPVSRRGFSPAQPWTGQIKRPYITQLTAWGVEKKAFAGLDGMAVCRGFGPRKTHGGRHA
jgi:hypothetical protein